MKYPIWPCLPSDLAPLDLPPVCTPSILLYNDLEVILHTCSITASKFISYPTQLQLRRWSPTLPNFRLQTYTVTASKCISTLPRLWPPSLHNHNHQNNLPNSLNYGLSVHLLTESIIAFNCIQTCTIAASKCLSNLALLRCSEMVDLEGRQHTINLPLYLAWNHEWMFEIVQFWFAKRWNRVQWYTRGSGNDETNKLRGSMNAGQECVRHDTNWVGLWKLGKSVTNQDLGMIEWVFHILQWCQSTAECPMYILTVDVSLSVIAVSP
jgi:hypothetical protein